MPPHCPYLATVQPEGLVGWLPEEEADEVVLLLLLVVVTTVEVLRVVATTVEEVGRVVEVVGWDGGVEPEPEPLQVNTSGPGTV